MRDANLSAQFSCFLYSLLSGAILGAVYTVLSFLRSSNPKGKIRIFILDILFMVIFAFLTMIFSIGFTDGIVRYYVVAGEIAGFFAWYLSLGRLICKAFGKVFSVLCKIRAAFRKNITVFSKKLLKARDKMLYNIEKKNHRDMDLTKGEKNFETESNEKLKKT